MQTTTSQDLSFLQKATAVRVSLGNLSFTKKIPQATVTAMVEAKDAVDIDQGAKAPEVSRDPARISASKKLLDCKEAADIKACYSALKAYIKSLTLPSPFGDGIYFVPNTRMEELDTEISRVQTEEVPRLAEALIAVYDQVLAKDREALGPDFDIADYDTPAEIRQRLKVEYQFITFGIPENLPNAMYAREQQKAREKLAGAVDTMQTLLRSEMDKLLKHAIDKLAGTKDDGKPLTFQKCMDFLPELPIQAAQENCDLSDHLPVFAGPFIPLMHFQLIDLLGHLLEHHEIISGEGGEPLTHQTHVPKDPE